MSEGQDGKEIRWAIDCFDDSEDDDTLYCRHYYRSYDSAKSIFRRYVGKLRVHGDPESHQAGVFKFRVPKTEPWKWRKGAGVSR